MDEDLVLSGTCQTKEKDYAAQSVRIEINKKGSVEEYIEKQKTGLSEFEISDYEVSNLEKVSGACKCEIQLYYRILCRRGG
jgi:hypothetical protein